MKRVASLLLGLWLLAGLVGCGGGGEAAVSAPASSQGSAAGSVPAEEPAVSPDEVRPAEERVDLLADLPVQEADAPSERMAHNIYADPEISGASGKYTGFLIDFRAEYAPESTYWALCNWTMNTDSLSGVTDNAGGYAGLQNNAGRFQAILSLWDITYEDASGAQQVLSAQRVYPDIGDTNRFDGEGEGANCILDYPWREGGWYRMYLNCYEDATSGRTFVETWFKDLESGVWTRVCCFDTGLSGSWLEGEMSQFMENYDGADADALRSFEYCNLYVRDYESGQWVPVRQARLSVDTWWDNKKGTFAFGAKEHTLWGVTLGRGPDSAKLDESILKRYPLTPYAPPDTPE